MLPSFYLLRILSFLQYVPVFNYIIKHFCRMCNITEMTIKSSFYTVHYRVLPSFAL